MPHYPNYKDVLSIIGAILLLTLAAAIGLARPQKYVNLTPQNTQHTLIKVINH